MKITASAFKTVCPVCGDCCVAFPVPQLHCHIHISLYTFTKHSHKGSSLEMLNGVKLGPQLPAVVCGLGKMRTAVYTDLDANLKTALKSMFLKKKYILLSKCWFIWWCGVKQTQKTAAGIKAQL